MGFRQLSEFVGKHESTVRSIVNADNRRAINQFGGCKYACSEVVTDIDGIQESNLKESELAQLSLAVTKLKVYLEDNKVSLDAPVLSAEEAKLANLENATSIYVDTINRLKEALDVAENPANNINKNLTDELETLKNTHSETLNCLKNIQEQNKMLSNELENLKSTSDNLNGDLLGLAGLLNPRLSLANTKQGEFDIDKATDFVEKLTRFIGLRQELVTLINSQSSSDVEAVNNYLLGVKSANQEFNEMMNKITKFTWKL